MVSATREIAAGAEIRENHVVEFEEGRLPQARATTTDRLRVSLDRLAALAEES